VIKATEVILAGFIERTVTGRTASIRPPLAINVALSRTMPGLLAMRYPERNDVDA
jgi:hypothetical protein